MHEDVKGLICEVGRRIWMRGFVAANDGNISVKVDDNRIITTPTGVSKGFMTPEMMVMVDLEGTVIEGSRRPSSELRMHLRVYRERPDVHAVVHTHAPQASAFAIARQSLETRTMAEAAVMLGNVPLAPFAMPSTEEVPDSITPYLKDHNVILLANHGVITLGEDLITAYYRMESVELFAGISLSARMLGGGVELSDEQLQRLYQIFKCQG